MTAILDVEGVTKRFGGVTAIDACSFAVERSTITALIGPNGSGKTTLFNVITGYLSRDQGTIRFDGRPIRRPNPTALYRLGLTRTFQQARVFPHLTLVENLVAAIPSGRRSMLGRRIRPTDRKTATAVLDEFGIGALAERPASDLSFGQRKLLEFATVMMGEPQLVLLDEPAAGINPLLIETIERHIRALNARGLTFLVVEHDMHLVMRLCDPVIVLDRGATIKVGSASVVQTDPRVLDAYLGQ